MNRHIFQPLNHHAHPARFRPPPRMRLIRRNIRLTIRSPGRSKTASTHSPICLFAASG